MLKIYPSLISSDLLSIKSTIDELEPYCAGFHIDIMDYHFVPNLTWGTDFVNAIRTATKKILWVHLMVEDPYKYLSRMYLLPGDIVSFHYEATADERLRMIVDELHSQNLKASLAINPSTAVEVIKPYKNLLDQVLLMSVNPGFSGQNFIQESFDRLKTLKDIKEEYELSFSLAMDGGLNIDLLSILTPEGLDTAALASALFQDNNPLDKLKLIQSKNL